MAGCHYRTNLQLCDDEGTSTSSFWLPEHSMRPVGGSPAPTGRAFRGAASSARAAPVDVRARTACNWQA
eukprot:1137442-Pelagomonas_calceolata.AAC.2